MTVKELYEFMRCELEDIKKKLSELSDVQNKLTELKLQVKIIWVVMGSIGLTTLGIIIKSLLGLVVK